MLIIIYIIITSFIDINVSISSGVKLFKSLIRLFIDFGEKSLNKLDADFIVSFCT